MFTHFIYRSSYHIELNKASSSTTKALANAGRQLLVVQHSSVLKQTASLIKFYVIWKQICKFVNILIYAYIQQMVRIWVPFYFDRFVENDYGLTWYSYNDGGREDWITPTPLYAFMSWCLSTEKVKRQYFWYDALFLQSGKYLDSLINTRSLYQTAQIKRGSFLTARKQIFGYCLTDRFRTLPSLKH